MLTPLPMLIRGHRTSRRADTKSASAPVSRNGPIIMVAIFMDAATGLRHGWVLLSRGTDCQLPWKIGRARARTDRTIAWWS